MRMLVLLVLVLEGSVRLEAGFSEAADGGRDKGMFVGNRSSRNVCQMMLGGLLMMLKRANLKTWAKLREKGVCEGCVSCVECGGGVFHDTYAVFVGRYRLREDVRCYTEYRAL